MFVDKAFKVLPDIFSLNSNDYSAFFPKNSISAGIQNRWIALGNRLHNAAISVETGSSKTRLSEVEILTALVLNSVRKELAEAIESSGLDTASVDVDEILEASDVKRMVEDKIRLFINQSDSNATLKTRNSENDHHTRGIMVNKQSNDKKENRKFA